MATEQTFERWYVLMSADAVATRSWTTEEIVDAHRLGKLPDRAVVYSRYGARRDGLTVKELVDRQEKDPSASTYRSSAR